MNIPHTQKGITLIETAVAVTILVAAITGPMTLASQSLKASRDARNELIATHLAEEGIEIVHNIRDNNSATDVTAQRTAWMNSITASCSLGCVIDPTDHSTPVWGPNVLLACPGGDCTSVKYLYYNPGTGLYKQNLSAPGAPWGATQFTRVITVESVGPALHQARVTAVVTYPGFGNIHTVTLTDDLYNWFPPLI